MKEEEFVVKLPNDHLSPTKHLGVLVALILCSFAVKAGDGQEVDFNRDIRPILASRCFHCHGPDENTREAGLRLDVKDDAFSDLGGYSAIVAGSPDKSELITRISSTDASELMPPAESKLELTDDERELMRRWIAEGAIWAKHWSFVRPKSLKAPTVARSSWPINEIDNFVLSRLEHTGLTPSVAASRRQLIRRVSLDLTGVPPTTAEVESFLSDNSPDAYEEVVDRLFASKRYGQRMAWEWLDAARYADTDGFQGDPTRSMWPWRDWLVNSLNDNKPFDQFTIELLAGDLLPDASEEQILASGFNRNHMYNGEGGRIAEETRVENVFDRTETTSTVWLGLTMTCARCHDHKFDPISQQEYYNLYAFFNNTSETGRGGTRGSAQPSKGYISPPHRKELAEIEDDIASLEQTMSQPQPEIDRAQEEWEADQRSSINEFVADQRPTKLRDWQQAGPIPSDAGLDEANALQKLFESLNKGTAPASLIGGQPWTPQPEYSDGEVIELPSTIGSTYLLREIEAASPRSLKVALGSDDGIAVWLNGKQLLDKTVARAAAPDQEFLDLPLSAGKNYFVIRIENTGGISGYYFRDAGESMAGLPGNIYSHLSLPAEKRSDKAAAETQAYYRSGHSKAWKKLEQKLARLTQSKKKILDAAPKVMIMDELPAENRRITKILQRGIYNKPTDQAASEGTLSVLHVPKTEPKNRLDLAHWIMDVENPLTARVTVNRYWQTFFGRGLVTSTEDFGQTGNRPSHPDLLDWLATEFIRSNWDVKALHRLIVTSATYRQSSSLVSSIGGNHDAANIDPNNELYWHAPRHRMPSWMLRDQALSVGGLLDDRLGGPSVKPYQPDGIWADATFGKIKYKQDSGESLYRRSLYIFWRRIVGPTIFFDAGKRQTCDVKPTRTNTPLHALTTLNETSFVESARGMATRILNRIDANDNSISASELTHRRLSLAFRLALAREPSAIELSTLSHQQRTVEQEFQTHPEEAIQFLEVGELKPDAKLDSVSVASWTVVCSTIMNLDEFLCRE